MKLRRQRREGRKRKGAAAYFSNELAERRDNVSATSILLQKLFCRTSFVAKIMVESVVLFLHKGPVGSLGLAGWTSFFFRLVSSVVRSCLLDDD